MLRGTVPCGGRVGLRWRSELGGASPRPAAGGGALLRERHVRVAADHGSAMREERTDAALRPRGWYKDHVLGGAREHGLPADYVREIEQIEPIDS